MVASCSVRMERGQHANMLDASVRLPPRGHKWIAVYTGAEPGKQIWKSTGLTDRAAAQARADALEAEARGSVRR